MLPVLLQVQQNPQTYMSVYCVVVLSLSLKSFVDLSVRLLCRAIGSFQTPPGISKLPLRLGLGHEVSVQGEKKSPHKSTTSSAA